MARSKSSTSILKATSTTAANLKPLPTIFEKEAWTDIPLKPAYTPQILVDDFTSDPPEYFQYDTFKADGSPQGYSAIGSYDLEAQAPITNSKSLSIVVEGVIVKGLLLGRKCWGLGKWLFDDEQDEIWERNGSWWV